MSRKIECPVSEEQLARLYEQGNSARALAARFNVSAPTALRWLKNANIDTTRKIKGWTISNGYRLVIVYPDWPFYSEMVPAAWAENADYSGYILEHRKVLADHLGRALLPTETVHHIDGDRLNNSASNLQLRQGKHGNGVTMRCRCCGSTDIEAIEV